MLSSLDWLIRVMSLSVCFLSLKCYLECTEILLGFRHHVIGHDDLIDEARGFDEDQKLRMLAEGYQTLAIR